ncbi:MAG: hypothetical protein GKS00_04855 [Alphaproteobacteria bacterium]|nr:hypothetical protein [Alphaproteobacteria bacterium]
MRHCAIRFFAFGLAIAASGCSSFDSYMAETAFQAKEPAVAASAPTYRVGDRFRYRVGSDFVTETVVRIDAEGVWWRSSDDRRWVGGDRALIPIHMVAETDGKTKVVKTKIESTGDLFPLTLGQTVAFRSAQPKGGKMTHNRSCTVKEFGMVMTAAGPFDAYRLHCSYDGAARVNYYAPELGRVVLQTANSGSKPIERELVGFIRSIDTPMQMAADSKKAAGPKMQKASAAKTANTAPRYGVQLAAYRSPTRIKRTWTWIKRRGGPLLAKSKPNIERHEKNGKAMYRLIVGDFKTQKAASRHCRALKRRNVDCWARAHGPDADPQLRTASGPALNHSVAHRQFDNTGAMDGEFAILIYGLVLDLD